MRSRFVIGALTVTLALTWPSGAIATDTSEPLDGPNETPTTGLVAGPGPWLVWERAPELDENSAEHLERRFGEPPQSPFGADTSVSRTFEQDGYALGVRDGDATRSDPHGLLDGYIPLRLWVMGPDGEVEKHRINRAYQVRNVAIGPAGILVRTRKGAAGSGIEQLALAGRFRKGELRNPCCDLRPDGTVKTDGSAGLPRIITFGQYRDKFERIGLRRADLAGPRYWLWRDGEGWSKAKAPPETGYVVATEDGYFLLGQDGRLHFSADLARWDVIDERAGATRIRAPWLGYLGDRILYVSDDEIAWVGPDGFEPAPFGQAVGEAGPIEFLRSYRDDPILRWPGSEAGLVLVHGATDSALFTPDNQAWGLAPLAAPSGNGSEFAIRDGELIQASYSEDGTWLAHRAVVTDERPG